MTRWLGLGALVGCAGSWVEPPSLVLPTASSGVVGAARVVARSLEACPLAVEATSGEHALQWTFPAAEAHDRLLWGVRADRTYRVIVRCGGLRSTIEWAVPPLIGPVPELTVHAHDPGRTEPGYTLLDASAGGEVDWVLVLDEALEVVWAQRKPPRYLLSVTAEAGDSLIGVVHPAILRTDWMGEPMARWVPEAREPTDVQVGWSLHHEAVPLADDRVLGLTWRPLEVPDYPRSEADPEALGPATLADDGVIVFDESGAVEQLHWLSDVLDTRRIGVGSLNSLSDTEPLRDWGHANAVVQDPADDGFLVTLRHQDALVKLTADGSLDWILGTPAGWVAPQTFALLTPVGDVQWPFHPHSAELAPDGSVVVFDNGNHQRTPYDPPGRQAPIVSRAVGYRVDPVARTVEQVWEYRDTVLGTLFSPAFGDADWLPSTNHVLAVFGRTRSIDGVPNVDAGIAESVVHLVELDPADPSAPPALHLELSSPRSTLQVGWGTYRAQRFQRAR